MSVKMDENSKSIFESCNISWTIENFYFACRSENYTVFSPEFHFQIFPSVKWKMSLELQYNPSEDHSLVSIYLEKLNLSEPKDICVNWEVILNAGEMTFGPSEKYNEFGTQRKHGHFCITNTTAIMETFLPLKPDTLFVSIYCIVFNKEMSLKCNEKLEYGLFLLSEDLKQLKDSEESYSDVKLKVKDKYINAHKAILSQNEKFESYINKSKKDVIEFYIFDYKTVNDFVHFLYSGNLEYCLAHPSISMINCMKHFNCDVLKPYCLPEEITMDSKLKIEYHEFLWCINDLFFCKDFVKKSPLIQKLSTNTTWRLTFSLNSKEPNCFVSIFAEIVNGDKPCYFCLDFSIVNESGKAFFAKRLVRNNQQYHDMGFKEFFKKDSLYAEESAYEDDFLRILFKIKTSDGSQQCSIGYHKMCFVSCRQARTYEKLSEKMVELFESTKYSDIYLECGKTTLKAHKCILVSRSSGFRQKIQNLSANEDTLILTDIEPDTLKMIVNYIYTGNLENLLGSDLIKVYYASSKEKLDIPSLNKDSSRILKEKNAYVYFNQEKHSTVT